MMFTLNGEILLDDSGSELAFKDFDVGDGEYSAFGVAFRFAARWSERLLSCFITSHL